MCNFYIMLTNKGRGDFHIHTKLKLVYKPDCKMLRPLKTDNSFQPGNVKIVGRKIAIPKVTYRRSYL